MLDLNLTKSEYFLRNAEDIRREEIDAQNKCNANQGLSFDGESYTAYTATGKLLAHHHSSDIEQTSVCSCKYLIYVCFVLT